MKPQLFIATNGLGVWYSDDLGENLVRMNSRMGMYSGNHVWALAADPSDPNFLLAGTNGGLFRLDRAKKQWTHVPSPMDERSKITAIAFSPHNPDVMLAGTQFAAMYRSEDHGLTWRKLDLDIVEICSNKNESRFTQIIFDPVDPRLAWAGVELDSVWRSTDGGITWGKTVKGWRPRTSTVCPSATTAAGACAATDRGVYVSRRQRRELGEGTVDSPSDYMRLSFRAPISAASCPDQWRWPSGLVGTLDAQPRQRGHWEPVKLPGEIQSTMWSVATHPADPNVLFASSCLGQIYRSDDGGEIGLASSAGLGDPLSFGCRTEKSPRTGETKGGSS
jgi:photosystem II stability/assembly factor-like uncharacterized protein